jgi:prolipoprotein diacylglyceryltransferase
LWVQVVLDQSLREAGLLDSVRRLRPTESATSSPWNLILAAALVWLGRHRAIRPPGLFALYVAGYCAFRIIDELLRVDPAANVFRVRWNLLVAVAGTLIGLIWFAASQRRPSARYAARAQS